MATIEDFGKLDIRIGTVRSAQKPEDSAKLLILEVDFGEETRTILAGIAKTYQPEDLIGKQMPFIVNLEPRKMGEWESQGMLLAADGDGAPALLYPNTSVPNGSRIR